MQPKQVVMPVYNPKLRAQVDAEREAVRPPYDGAQGAAREVSVGVWFQGEPQPYATYAMRAVAEGSALRAVAHRLNLRPHQLRGPRPEYRLGVMR